MLSLLDFIADVLGMGASIRDFSTFARSGKSAKRPSDWQDRHSPHEKRCKACGHLGVGPSLEDKCPGCESGSSESEHKLGS